MLKNILPALKLDLRKSAAGQSSSSTSSCQDVPLALERLRPKAPVLGVLGAKGGAGATSIAVNLAAALAAQVETTIVDANFQEPDVAHVLGQEPLHSVMEMIARQTELDGHLLDACLTPVSSCETRLSLLSPPLDGEAAVRANLSELSRCLKAVRSLSGCWVIDMPRHLDKHLVTLADLCDKILLVFEATVSGIASTQRWLRVFAELGYERERVICVLNRSGSKHSGIEQQLDSCFSGRTIARIPNASAVLWQCSTRGVPVVCASPNQAYSRAIVKLSEELLQSTQRR